MDEPRIAQSAIYEVAERFADEDRRPLDVEFERLEQAMSQLEDELERLSDRLQPVVSDRPSPGTLLEAQPRGDVDARSTLVKRVESQRWHVERIRERVESLFVRVDC